MEPRFEPPYYAVIFISTLSAQTDGYADAADRMFELAQAMPGFLGFASAREERGISVSFWQDEASIENWKQQAEHLAAQQRGKQQWYSHYELHVARVERYHSHSQDNP